MKKDDILDVSNEEKRIAFDLYQALKDIEEQYTGETIAGDPSPQNLDPSDRRQGTLMAGGDFPEFETYADVIDAYNSGVAVEPGESLTDYIKRNNIKIKEIEMDPLGDLKKVELVDELEPGPLKDELLKDFDPSQETYEEYLQRKNLDRPFNAADGGRVMLYAGESVEPFLQQIKKLFLEGNTDREIAKIIKQPRGTVAKAINSMKNGSAPVKISNIDIQNRVLPAKSNLAKSQNVTKRINNTYKDLVEKLGKPPTRSQLATAANVAPGTIKSNTPNLKFTSAADEGAKATAEMYKKLKVDKPTRTTYEGVKGAKFKNAAQEKKYKEFLEKAAKFPKGSPNNPFDKKFFAKEFNMPETDVESIHKVIREKYNITYPKATSTSAGIRAGQLREKSDIALEQEYTKLKKGERIGNPDLAHRVSKKYNVTTSNLGLDNPLINRVIVKPNERSISRLYDKREKIENKYKLKDGTFKKPSKEDIKILEKINNDVETLARETKGRLSAVVNDPTNLNKPYGSLGVDASKTIGGGVIDVDLKDVRKLPLEDQAFLKANLLELKNKELGKTPEMLADEFKDVLNKPDVQKRIENIISKGNMEKPYVDQAKKLLNIGKTVARPLLRVAAPFIPVLGALGVGLGAADVAKAAEFTKKPDELGLAYLLGPEKAKDYSEFKESIRGKADETEEFVP